MRTISIYRDAKGPVRVVIPLASLTGPSHLAHLHRHPAEPHHLSLLDYIDGLEPAWWGVDRGAWGDGGMGDGSAAAQACGPHHEEEIGGSGRKDPSFAPFPSGPSPVPSLQPIFMSIRWPTLLAAIGVCTLTVWKESVSRSPSRPRSGMDWGRDSSAPSTSSKMTVQRNAWECDRRWRGSGGEQWAPLTRSSPASSSFS